MSCQLFKRAFHAGAPAVHAGVLSECFIRMCQAMSCQLERTFYASVSCGCFMRVLHASCLLLQVMCNRGGRVARAVATVIAILPPPSEKMAKLELDKSFQNDKTRA